MQGAFFSVVLEREGPGCPATWVGTSLDDRGLYHKFMHENFGRIFRALLLLRDKQLITQKLLDTTVSVRHRFVILVAKQRSLKPALFASHCLNLPDAWLRESSPPTPHFQEFGRFREYWWTWTAPDLCFTPCLVRDWQCAWQARPPTTRYLVDTLPPQAEYLFSPPPFPPSLSWGTWRARRADTLHIYQVCGESIPNRTYL